MPMQDITFYDEHPFGWVERYKPRELARVVTPLLAAAVHEAPVSGLSLDIGCGAGRVMAYLAWKGYRCVGLDRSKVSARLMTEHAGKPGVVADNLELPFQDGTADLVVSDGVIHHTGDPFKAFAENCRVLKSGGLFYLAVYKPGGRYPMLYRYPGSVVRRLVRHAVGKALVHSTLVPLYWLVHLAKSMGKRTWSGAKHMFYDYFATPQVTFLSYADIEAWCSKCGLDIKKYEPNPRLNVHSFLLQRRH